MSDVNFNETILTFLVTQSLPVLLDPESQEPQAIQIRLLANSLYVEYLASSAEQKAEFLKNLVTISNKNLEILQRDQELINLELNKLAPPLSLNPN